MRKRFTLWLKGTDFNRKWYKKNLWDLDDLYTDPFWVLYRIFEIWDIKTGGEEQTWKTSASIWAYDVARGNRPICKLWNYRSEGTE